MLDNRKKLQLVLAKRGYMNEDLVNEIEQIYNKQQLPIHGVVKSFTCDVCYKETSNKKDDEGFIYCDSCNEL